MAVTRTVMHVRNIVENVCIIAMYFTMPTPGARHGLVEGMKFSDSLLKRRVTMRLNNKVL